MRSAFLAPANDATDFEARCGSALARAAELAAADPEGTARLRAWILEPETADILPWRAGERP